MTSTCAASAASAAGSGRCGPRRVIVPALKLVASGTHILFYVLLIGMPLSGAAAWILGVAPAAQAHSVAEKLLILLIGLHVLAALAQHFWFKTDVLKRMVGRA